MESNDSPEIPDREETSDIPGLPLGGGEFEVSGGNRNNKIMSKSPIPTSLLMFEEI